jgi:hypothetical protein
MAAIAISTITTNRQGVVGVSPTIRCVSFRNINAISYLAPKQQVQLAKKADAQLHAQLKANAIDPEKAHRENTKTQHGHAANLLKSKIIRQQTEIKDSMSEFLMGSLLFLLFCYVCGIH